MRVFIFFLDAFGIVTALLAAWFWYRASRQRLRRISRYETLDVLDINRIITVVNRSNLLNSNAALAATASAVSLALRFAIDLIAI